MTDRELLELAAKAAGYDYRHSYDENITGPCIIKDGFPVEWDPLADNGDALLLAADLEIDIVFRVVGGRRVEALAPGCPLIVMRYDGRASGPMRQAITLAAAEYQLKKERMK